MLLSAAVMLGVANRVLNRMAVVPMAQHLFFLAQAQTCSYIIVYTSALIARYRSGHVTDKMMDTAWASLPLFAVIGAFEALATILLYTSAANLPGAVVPVLSQSMLFWSFLLSALILRRRFAVSELVGALLVMAGVAFVTLAKASANTALAVDPFYAALFVAASSLPAAASICKETLFQRGLAMTGGQPLDVFVVNTFGSWAQAVCTLLLLPVIAAQRGLQLEQLPEYLAQGARAFVGASNDVAMGSGYAWLPCAYVLCNLIFNVCVLASLRAAGAATLSVSMTAVVPLSIWAFTLPLPLLGAAPQLGSNFLVGAVLLMAGLAAYHSAKFRRSATIQARD